MVEAWTGTILDVDEPSNEDLGYHGGNEIDRINKLLKGVNLTTEEGADVTINTNWYFYDNKLRINDGLGHSIILQLPPGMTTDKTLVLPNANATLATSISATPNDFGTNMQQFVSGNIKIKDADQSHAITLNTSGLTANFPLLFPTPGHATDEEIIYSRKAQTLYDKTLSNPTFAAMNIFIDSNTIKHSTTNAEGDLMAYTTSGGVNKYARFPRGTSLQYLRTNSAGTGIEWATLAGGGGGGGDITGAANVGAGTIGVFRDEISGILNFKRLIAGTNITLTNGADDITIAATGSGSTSSILVKGTNSVVVNNTTALQNFLSYTFAANEMGTNKIYRFLCKGTYLNNSGSSKNVRILIKFGVSTIIDATLNGTDSSATPRLFTLEFYFANAGVHNSQLLIGRCIMGDNNDVAVTGFASLSTDETNVNGDISGSCAEATNVSKTLLVQYNHSAAHASTQMNRQLVFLKEE